LQPDNTLCERAKARARSTASALKARIWKYFSGKLALIQIGAGIGALILRSAAAYLASNMSVPTMVFLAMIGSFVGYITAYMIGYWVVFREDYRASGRSMLWDVFRLQLVEQLPNVGTVIAAGLTQGVLISSADVPPVLAVNIGSWFGPQKIVNVAAMLTSNSLKKAWVDDAWRPRAIAHAVAGGVRRAGGKGRALLGGRRSQG
jgi:hypothetical protein